MATIQKTSRLTFYKPIAVKPVRGDATVNAVNLNTSAINNLGTTVNSLTKSVQSIKMVMLGQLEKSAKESKTFNATYNKPAQRKSAFGGFLQQVAKGTGGFLEGIMKILGAAFKFVVGGTVLKWIADPANRKKLENILSGIGKVLKFIAGWAKFGIVNTIEGLYTLLSNESSGLEKVGGLVKGLTGLGTLMLGIRWLKNPTRLITDFGNVLIFLYNNLVRGRRGLLGRAGALGLLAAGGFAAYKMYGYMKDGDKKPTELEEGQEPEEQKPQQQLAKGGVVKAPQFAKGGFINGPQSGYPVSLDGGRSTAFIGHGTEYVARKANGGAFVVPLNTPATARQPHLTDRRISEANSLGFNLGGMMNAKSILPKSEKHMAQGGNLDKQIYLHWTAGGYNHKAGPYHATVQGDGKIYRHLPYNARTGHTYNRNSGNVGLSAATMGGRAWVDYPPKPIQYENMMKEAASIATKWGWKPGDVNIKRVMTHAEAGSNKDGRRMHDNYGPVAWGGTGERWDWWHLKKSDSPGTGGDKLRQMMKKYMGDPNAQVVPEAGGSVSAGDALTGDGSAMTNIPLSLSGRAKEMVGGDGNFLAEVNRVAKAVKAHPADLLGLMASESGLDPKAQNKSGATGLIQFMPDTAAGLGTSTSALMAMNRAEQMKYVEKFLKKSLKGVPLKDGKVSAGNLYTAVYLPAFAAKGSDYIVAKKGGFTDSWGNHPAAWYDHNSGLDLNGDGAISIGELGKRIADKKKEFGINGGTMSIPASSIASPADHEDSNISTVIPTKTFLGGFTEAGMGRDIFTTDAAGFDTSYASKERARVGGVSPSRGGSSTRSGGGASPARGTGSNVGARSEADQRRIEKITEQRNDARRQINERSQEMIKQALEAVGQANGVNKQMIAAANQQIQAIIAQTKSSPSQPQYIPTGGSTTGGGGISGAAVGGAIGGRTGAAIGGTAAAVLNSFNNPLRGIFR